MQSLILISVLSDIKCDIKKIMCVKIFLCVPFFILMQRDVK